MPGRIDQVQGIIVSVLCPICHMDSLAFDRYASFPLQFHTVKDLFNHLAVLEDAGLFKNPVCQCAFSVVDVRYDAEIADPVHFVVHGSSDRPERFPSLFSVPFKSLPILA